MDLLLQLQKYTGDTTTSNISLHFPSNGQLSMYVQHLNAELGTASNIKSRTNRQSVERSLRTIMAHLKSLKKMPENGLAIFAGENIGSWF